MANSTNTFKHRLDIRWQDQEIIYNFRAVYVKISPANPPVAGPTFGPHRWLVGPLVFLCLDHRPYVVFLNGFIHG